MIKTKGNPRIIYFSWISLPFFGFLSFVIFFSYLWLKNPKKIYIKWVLSKPTQAKRNCSYVWYSMILCFVWRCNEFLVEQRPSLPIVAFELRAFSTCFFTCRERVSQAIKAKVECLSCYQFEHIFSSGFSCW